MEHYVAHGNVVHIYYAKLHVIVPVVPSRCSACQSPISYQITPI